VQGGDSQPRLVTPISIPQYHWQVDAVLNCRPAPKAAHQRVGAVSESWPGIWLADGAIEDVEAG
jgi:hypothetical protein